MEDKEYIKSSAKWLLEMNFLDNDYVKTTILTNIYMTSSFISDLDILVDQHNRRMLIYLELSFFGRFFRKHSKISEAVLEVVGEALPTYELRVIYDKELLEKSIRLMNPEPPAEEVKKEEPLEESSTEEEKVGS